MPPARTFGYKADEQRLRDMGLIRGAGPESTIILDAKGPDNGPLRFADEYVRHKVLDLIGDLALAGRRIEGHVVAERAGHAMHTALVSRLIKDRSAWELAHVPMAESAPRRSCPGPPARRRILWRRPARRIVSSASRFPLGACRMYLSCHRAPQPGNLDYSRTARIRPPTGLQNCSAA